MLVIGVLSLVQIIYLTEAGTIIIKSEITLNNRRMVTFMCSRKVMAEALIFLLLFRSG